MLQWLTEARQWAGPTTKYTAYQVFYIPFEQVVGDCSNFSQWQQPNCILEGNRTTSSAAVVINGMVNVRVFLCHSTHVTKHGQGLHRHFAFWILTR